jgi:hypothetical protein
MIEPRGVARMRMSTPNLFPPLLCVRTKVTKFSYQQQMKTYDSAWVERQVDQTVKAWRDSAGVAVPQARRYSLGEQRSNEAAYDDALFEVEEALRPPPITGKVQTLVQQQVVSAFARFSANALGLDREATELLTNGFLPVGTSLARWARRFDPDLSMAGIIQAARNAWTACGLQPLWGFLWP